MTDRRCSADAGYAELMFPLMLMLQIYTKIDRKCRQVEHLTSFNNAFL